MIVRTMPGAFGAIAEDVDLSRDCTEATIRTLIDALHAHQILVIKDQNLSDGDYVGFGRQFGTPLNFFLAIFQE